MKRIWMPALLLLAACSQSPEEQRADQLRDAADAQADAIEEAAEDRAAQMEAQAAELNNQAGQVGGYDAQRLRVRVDALKREADLVEDQAEAQARAIRDEGKARASAVLAK